MQYSGKEMMRFKGRNSACYHVIRGAHTVLQSSQQGDDASIQQVPIIVQTHDVTVEHPAELQHKPEKSRPEFTEKHNLNSTGERFCIYLSSINAQLLCLYHLRATTPNEKTKP